MINSNTNNSNVMHMQATTIKRGKLPLWAVVLFITVLLLLLNYVAIYFYHQQERNEELQIQQVLIEEKEKLLEQDDVIKTNWLRTLNNKVKNVQGGVIWSGKLQQGIIYVKNLPETIKQQHYRLWVYDLATKANKRVSAALFQHKGNRLDEFLVKITPEVPVKNPYKFELILLESVQNDLSIDEQNNVNKDVQTTEQPLLFAQP